MTAHSPGPWNAEWSPMAIYDGDGKCVVRRPGPPAPQECWPANARLIAAAPEMRALLERLSGETAGLARLDKAEITALIRRIEGTP